MHKELVLSSWPMEDVEGKAKEMDRVSGGSQKKKKAKVGTERWRCKGKGRGEQRTGSLLGGLLHSLLVVKVLK